MRLAPSCCLAIFGAIIGFPVLVAGGISSTLLAPVKTYLEGSLSSQLGRAVVIKDLHGNPLDQLTAEGVTIFNGTLPSSGDLLVLDKLILKYRPLKIFSEKKGFLETIESVTVVGPTIYLIKDPRGVWSFVNASAGVKSTASHSNQRLDKPDIPSQAKPITPFIFPDLKGKLILTEGKLVLIDLLKDKTVKIDHLEGSLDFIKKTLSFSGRSGTTPRPDIFLNGKFDLKKGEGRLHLRGASVDLSSYGVFFTFLPWQIKEGSLSVELQLEAAHGSLQDVLERMKIDGNLYLEQAQVRVYPFQEDFRRLKAKASIHNGTFEVETLTAELGQSQWSLKGNIRNFTKPQVSFLIQGNNVPMERVKDYLPLKTVSARGTVQVEAKIEGLLQEVLLDVHLEAPEVGIGILEFSNASLTLSFAHNQFSLKDFHALFLGGELHGAGSIQFKETKQGLRASSYNLSFSGDKEDLSLGKSLLPGVELSGHSNLVFSLSGRGDSPIYKGRLTTSGPFGVLDQSFAALSADFSLEGQIFSFGASTADSIYRVEGNGTLEGGKKIFKSLKVTVSRASTRSVLALLRPWLILENLSGEITLAAELQGSLDYPKIEGNLELSNGRFNQFPIENLHVPLKYSEGQFIFGLEKNEDSGILLRSSGRRLLRVNGSLPYAWGSEGLTKIQNKEMALKATSPDGDLSILTALPFVAEAAGQVKLEMTIKGTFLNPIVDGLLTVHGGSLIPNNFYAFKENFREKGRKIEDLDLEAQFNHRVDSQDQVLRNFMDIKTGKGRSDKPFVLSGYLAASHWAPDAYLITLETQDHDQGIAFDYCPEFFRGSIDAKITFEKLKRKRIYGTLNFINTVFSYAPRELPQQQEPNALIKDVEWDINVGFRKKARYINREGIGRLVQGALGLKDVKLITNISVDIDSSASFLTIKTDPNTGGGLGQNWPLQGKVFFVSGNGRLNYINTIFTVKDRQGSAVDTNSNRGNPLDNSNSQNFGTGNADWASDKRGRLEFAFDPVKEARSFKLYVYGETGEIRNPGIIDPATQQTGSPKNLDKIVMKLWLWTPSDDELREKNGYEQGDRLPFVVEFASTPPVSKGDILTFLTIGKGFSTFEGQNIQDLQKQGFEAIFSTTIEYLSHWIFGYVSDSMSWFADVFTIKRSEEAAALGQQGSPASANGTGPLSISATATTQNSSQIDLTSLLRNVELEVGKNFTQNIYVDYKLISLETNPTAITANTGSPTPFSFLGSTVNLTLGHQIGIEYRYNDRVTLRLYHDLNFYYNETRADINVVNYFMGYVPSERKKHVSSN